MVTAQVARHEEENSVGPATAAGDPIQFRDAADDFFQTGGFGLIQDKNFERDALRRLGDAPPRPPRDQGRPRVRARKSRGHEAHVGRPAGRHLRERGRSVAADLPPLLLDDARRDGRQRADLAAQRIARAQGHHRLSAGPLVSVTDRLVAELRRALGPPADHRRLGRRCRSI